MFNGRGNRGQNNRGPPARNRYATSNQDAGLGNVSGPLMTEHLNLRALDLELALLKQKREIIEQQQEMLNYGNQSNYYNQPGFQSQASSVQGFSQYYDEPRRDHGTKRRAIPVWDNAPEPKRFGSDTPAHSRRHDTFQAPQNRGYGVTRRGNPKPPPLMAKPASRPRFTPNKVTKPKPSPAALKTIKNAPVADRKNLVSRASTAIEDLKLYEDESKTSSKVLGRLELALGVILREVKDLYGKKEPALNHPALKAIKKEIRTRMRKVMMGKEVTTTTAIVEQYRKVYPKKTNSQILKSGIDAMKTTHSSVGIDNLAIKIIDKGRPDMYFRNNFTNLLSVKLDEMFDNLRKLYKPDDRNIITIMQDILAKQDMQLLLKDVQKATKDLDGVLAKEKPDEGKKDDAENKNGDAENKDDEAEKKNGDAEIKTEGEENKTHETEKSDEEKNTEHDVSIVDVTPKEPVIDLDASTEGDNLNETDVKENSTDEKENSVDEKETSIDEKETSIDQKDISIDQKEKSTANEENEPEKNESEEAKEARKIVLDRTQAFRFRYFNKVIDVLLNSKLPLVMQKYKKVIIDEIITSNEDYKNTLAYILVETKKREQRREAAIARSIAERGGGQKKPALYFVKIFGKPSLPKRPVMQSFLDKYNPSTIKKHRSFNSLLFVGFANQQDYDNILAANKTVLGKCTLDIKPSENKFNNTKDQGKDKEQENVKIDSDMDMQIDDLLQSIRTEEESLQKKDSDGGEKKEEVKQDSESYVEQQIDDILNDAPEGFKVIDEATDSDNGDDQVKTNGGNDSAETAEDKTAETAETKKSESTENTSTENVETNAEIIEIPEEDTENPLKESVKGSDEGKATPKRSTRIATSTPTIKTRRGSRLNPN